MNREDFLSLLSEKIAVLPADEKNKVYEYYNEIILDKKEGGMPEDEIIAEFGPVDDIAAKLLSEYPEAGGQAEPAAQFLGQQPIPETAYQQAPPAPKKLSGAALAWIIVAAVFTSPIWIGLGAGAFALVVSVVASIVSLLIALWVAAVALILGGLLILLLSFSLFPQGIGAACFNIGISLFCIGLGCLLTVGMVHLTKLSCRFLRWMFQKIIGLFRRKQPKAAERSAV